MSGGDYVLSICLACLGRRQRLVLVFSPTKYTIIVNQTVTVSCTRMPLFDSQVPSSNGCLYTDYSSNATTYFNMAFDLSRKKNMGVSRFMLLERYIRI